MEDSINEKLLEKLKVYSLSLNYDTELLRAAASKLHSRVSSQDKQIREKTLFQIRKKKDNALQILLTLLESVDDRSSAVSIASVIRECISPKAGISRFSVLRQLVELNASQNFIKLLMQQSVTETYISDRFLHELIWIVGQLSQKDPKFAGKIRQLNALPTFNLYLKISYQHNSKLVVPLLMAVKAIAKNCNLLSALVNDGISLTIEKIFRDIDFAATSKLKLLLNIFSNLSKNTQFCNRMIRDGVVPVLLKIFSRWEKYNGKTRLKICTDTVIILQHICFSKQGRNAIRRENGFSPLYKFCLSCPEDKVYDRLLAKVCSIINVCLQKKELPVCSVLSPIQFSLPIDLKKDQYDTIDSDDSDEVEENLDDDENQSSNEDGDDDPIEKKSQSVNDLVPAELPQRTTYYSISDLQQYYRKMFVEHYFLFYNGKHDSSASIMSSDEKNKRHRYRENNSNDRRRDGINDAHVICEYTTNSLPTLQDLDNSIMTQRSLYCKIASRVRHVTPFIKVAYPDMMGGDGIGILQPFYSKDRKVCRNYQTFYASIDAFGVHNYASRFFKKPFQKRTKLVAGVDRYVTEDRIYNNVVYDLDTLVKLSQVEDCLPVKLSNEDETRIGIKEQTTSTLNFESRFESGNLRKAIQVGPREYDLILTPDVNSSSHCQWFYFEVSNMDNVASYTFNIVNCEKSNSQFNYGMKPILYSVREAMLKHPGWFRTGTEICYYRNGYKVPHNHKKTFHTATFNIKFPHSLDVCYIAYTFPYTYSQLLYRIRNWTSQADQSNIYMRAESLCSSLNCNSVPLLTITAPDTKDNRIADREIVFLTSRVHPGEANSSWVIDGSISQLLANSGSALKLRNQYIFKIVPMLNVEGVINGCHRCDLTDEDLNRKWSHPDRQLHPSIYHAKGLLEYCTRVLRKSPFLFCDFHGHSRRKNAFFFGCSNQESWMEADRNLPSVGIEHLLLPHLMESCAAAFSSELCNYRVERDRESTARVTVWREFGVRKSYTMETSYCGCDQGPYKGFHLDTNHLQEIGANFCTALTCLHDDKKWKIEMLLVKQDGNRYIYSSSNHVNYNYVQNKDVQSATMYMQTKPIHPASPVWNVRKTAINQRKIIPAATQTNVNVHGTQSYFGNVIRKEKFYNLTLDAKI